MRKSIGPRIGLAVAIAAMTSLAACGSGSGNSSSSSGTVSVNVGTNKPIKLKKGKLKIGILMNDTANAWEQGLSQTAKKTAESYGWTADILTPGFDVQKQLNQAQTAATSRKYDAILAIPTDGKLTCSAFTKTLPQANVLVSIVAQPVCGRDMAVGDDLWAPGTLNWVGGTGTTATYFNSWLNAAAKANPGKQKAVFIAGPEVITLTNQQKQVVKAWQPKNPDFKIENWVYTDFTTPTSYTATLAYLKAHPDTTVILSSYSPDLTRGVIQAVKALGMQGKVKVVDSGGSTYSYQGLKDGSIQLTSPLFPKTAGKLAIQSIKAAQEGKKPVRFISDIPASLGTLDNIPVITKDNMDTYTPQF